MHLSQNITIGVFLHHKNNRQMGKIRVRFSAKGLPRKDLFSKSDPFLCVLMASSAGNFQIMAKTNWIKNNHDPDWDEIEIEDDTIDQNNYRNLKAKLEV